MSYWQGRALGCTLGPKLQQWALLVRATEGFVPRAVEKQEKRDMGREGAAYVMVITDCSFRFRAALSARKAIAAAAAGRRGASSPCRCIDKIPGKGSNSASRAGPGFEPSPTGNLRDPCDGCRWYPGTA